MKSHTLAVLAILAVCATTQGKISLTPSDPTANDEIEVTVSRWTNTGGYHIDDMTAHVFGSLIYVDLFWSVPSPGTPVTQACMLHEQTVSLGTLDAGMYKLRVTHRGMNVPAESTSFTVSPSQTAEPDPTSEPACDCICHRWPQMFAGRVCPFCGCGDQDTPDDGTPSLLDRLHDLFGT